MFGTGVPNSLLWSARRRRGAKVSVPGSMTQVLRTRYGDTWMVPR